MISAPGLRHGLEDSVGKSASKSVDRIGFPVVGWIGFALGSIVEVCRAGYSVPGFSFTEGLERRSSDCSFLIPATGVADALRVSCSDNADGGNLLASLLGSQLSKKVSLQCEDLRRFGLWSIF